MAAAETGYQDSGLFNINTDQLTGDYQPPDFLLVNHLRPCHPNPFNPHTTVSFFLAKSGPVQLAVFDMKGSLVKTLYADENLLAGPHEMVWSGKDNSGQPVGTGVYLCRLRSGDFTASRRMTLIK